MAEQILSAGAYIQEKDQSFVPAGTPQSTFAFVGPTPEGPAFIPTVVNSYSEYEVKFGVADGKSYIPYAVQEYLKNTQGAMVTRVLGLGGYTQAQLGVITVGGKVAGVLHPTNASYTGNFSASVATTQSYSTTNFILSGSNVTGYTVSASMSPTATNYIGKIFGKSPVSTLKGYNIVLFDKYLSSSAATDATTIRFSDSIDFATDYSQATTPYITSQLVSGTGVNLFKVHTRTDGNNANRKIKVAISGIKLSTEQNSLESTPYSTFNLTVRKYDDSDRNQVVYETFANLDLNPDSPNYICRRIGDKYAKYVTDRLVTYGDYDNLSDYIYIEPATDVKNKAISNTLYPWGFAAVQQPISITGLSLPTASIVVTQSFNGSYNDKIHYGFNFDFVSTDNLNYLNPIGTNANGTYGDNTAFNLDNITGTTGATYTGSFVTAASTATTQRQFVVPFQGGFDGTNPAIPVNMAGDISASNTLGYNLSSSTASGSVAYKRILDLLSNKDLYDISALFIPGVIGEYHTYVVNEAISMCENRGDSIFVLDPTALTTTTNASVTAAVNSFDSSYATSYHPWLKILDVALNKQIWVTPSCVLAGVFSYNDRVGHPWFAPAGVNRGNASTVIDVYTQLNKADRDSLYQGRINPIVKFPIEGICVWGQKTLQVKASALDRVNVRRLLIDLKKNLDAIIKTITFEQNTNITRKKFINSATPYFEYTQSKQGIYEYRLLMSENENTAEVIDRNELRGKVFIKPTKTSEFIIIDLVVAATGATLS